MKTNTRFLSRHKTYEVQCLAPDKDTWFKTFDCIDGDAAMGVLEKAKQIPGQFRIVETITTRRIIWPEGCELGCLAPRGHSGDCLVPDDG